MKYGVLIGSVDEGECQGFCFFFFLFVCVFLLFLCFFFSCVLFFAVKSVVHALCASWTDMATLCWMWRIFFFFFFCECFLLFVLSFSLCDVLFVPQLA